ncbi:MAG: hypothetical protein QG673_19 [Pseudomonadota bacterium]|nr:hypothetical protein [Pseudomonadota bacterium]
MNYDINLDQIKEYNTHGRLLNKDKAALLVIEMQEVFRTEMLLISEKQIINVKKLIHFATTNGIHVIHIRHNDSSDSSANMITWWDGDKIEYGSEGWKIVSELDITNQIIIDKSQYSAFFNTNLDEILKSNGITDIIISGLMANCCCDTTARDAFMRGYNVFFVNDATSTINAELHLAAIKNLAIGFANVVNTVDLINQM